MTGRGFGNGMVLLAARIEHAFPEQEREATVELASPAVEIVGAELVDGDGDDQPRGIRR